MVYGYILTSLVTKVFAEDRDLTRMANGTLNTSSVIAVEQTELSDPCPEMLGLLIDDCIILGHKYLKLEIPRFLYYLQKAKNQKEKLDKAKTEVKTSEQIRRQSNLKTLRDSCKEELVAYYSILKQADSIQKFQKQTADLINSQEASDFKNLFNILGSYIESLPRTQSVSIFNLRSMPAPREEDVATRITRVRVFLLENKDQIKNIFLPVIKGCCKVLPKIVIFVY